LAHTIAQGLLAGYDELGFGLGISGSSSLWSLLLFGIKNFLVNNLENKALILLEFL